MSRSFQSRQKSNPFFDRFYDFIRKSNLPLKYILSSQFPSDFESFISKIQNVTYRKLLAQEVKTKSQEFALHSYEDEDGNEDGNENEDDNKETSVQQSFLKTSRRQENNYDDDNSDDDSDQEKDDSDPLEDLQENSYDDDDDSLSEEEDSISENDDENKDYKPLARQKYGKLAKEKSKHLLVQDEFKKIWPNIQHVAFSGGTERSRITGMKGGREGLARRLTKIISKEDSKHRNLEIKGSNAKKNTQLIILPNSVHTISASKAKQTSDDVKLVNINDFLIWTGHKDLIKKFEIL